MIFQLFVEYFQGFVCLDRFRKIIPPARNSEWKLDLYIILHEYSFFI